MTAPLLQRKETRVSRGYTYSYFAAVPRDGKPTVLMLHGWPDDATMWLSLAEKHLLPAGYGVVIPDTLGYGGTSKERDPQKYRLSSLVRDLLDVLDAEAVNKVVCAGHDWGSTLAQRFYFFAPSRTIALALVCLAYIPPSDSGVDLERINEMHEQAYGMRCFEYMNFFASDDSDAVFDAHLEAAFHLCYTDDFARATRDYFSQSGKVRELVESNTLLPLHPSVTAEQKEQWIARMKRDGFNGPFNYYRLFVHLSKQPDKAVAGPRIEVPTLFVGYTDDLICRKENILNSEKAGLLPKLTNVTLSGGHFGLAQDPSPFGDAFVSWLAKAASVTS